MPLIPASFIEKSWRKALSELEYGSLEFVAPNGEVTLAKGRLPGPAARFAIKEWDVLRKIMARGDIGLGEEYIAGAWETDSVENLVSLFLLNLDHFEDFSDGNLINRIGFVIHNALVRRNSLSGAARNIKDHYDVGNDFYALWLDPSMTYSSALYAGTDELYRAQQNKYERILSKFGSKASVLEIGCGWGGFAERAAADNHHVTGLTISPSQFKFATNRLGGAADIRLQDYRELNERFDRIASVGMMEHVGQKNYRTYLATAARCLDRGGLFLCHTIGATASHVTTDPWLNRYIFPDSMLPAPAQVTRAAEGLFVLEDVHNFGPYYDRTLRAWECNFAQAWPRFRDLYGERFGRMWRYYLLSCAGAFRSRAIELYQFVFAKGGVPGGYTAVR